MTITVRLGTPADNAKIQDLVTKITMPGVAQMCFQRAPDFFAGAKVIGDEFVLTVADDDERPDVLAGLTVISGRELFISGQKRRVYYSGDTRVDPFYRRRGIASNLFVEQKKFRTGQDLLQGIVLKENTAPLDAAAKTADGVLFSYWISHAIETSFIFTRKITPRVPQGVQMRAATAADVPRFKQMFVFHPYDYAIQSIDWERRVRREWRKIPTDQHPPITDVELLAHLNQRESVAVYAAKREREKNGTTQRFSTTRHLLIDLDLGNGHEDVLARAAGERKALGAPTFALSSPGGGVHRIPRRHGSLPRGSLISRAGERVPATIRPRRVSARSGQSEH